MGVPDWIPFLHIMTLIKMRFPPLHRDDPYEVV